jgi:hypothetical protein
VTAGAAFADREVLQLLGEEPELLAIADAIAVTQARARRRRPLARVLLVAAALAALIAMALATPWERSRTSIVDKALGALGDREVIHVVLLRESADPLLVDLQTGRETPTRYRTEIWFDERRGLERSVTKTNGRTSDVQLSTRAGVWTPEGRVLTCAWIAGHPLEARKRRVSCDTGGGGGAARRVREPRPVLDPALAGFVTGYRDALASRAARRIGMGVVDGRAVEWLEFALPSTAGVGARSERVAVERQSGRPLLVRALVDGKVVAASRVRTAETVTPAQADFTKPKPIASGALPEVGSIVRSKVVPIGAVSSTLGGRVVWMGRRFAGLPLSEARLDRIKTFYGFGTSRRSSTGAGVQLLYGERSPAASARFVSLRESFGPQLAYGFGRPSMLPPAGRLLVRQVDVEAATGPGGRAAPTGTVLWLGLLVKDRLFVALEASSKGLLLSAARSLVGAGAAG